MNILYHIYRAGSTPLPRQPLQPAYAAPPDGPPWVHRPHAAPRVPVAHLARRTRTPPQIQRYMYISKSLKMYFPTHKLTAQFEICTELSYKYAISGLQHMCQLHVH